MIKQQHSDTNHIFLRSFFARLGFWVVICFSCLFVQAQSFYVVRSSVGHHMGSNFTASTTMYKANINLEKEASLSNNSGQTTQPSSLEVCSGLNYE